MSTAILSTLGGDSVRARLGDPLTSHEAADSNISREVVESHVLHLFDTLGPMTDAELTDCYQISPSAPRTHFDSPRKRRSELSAKGELVKSNVTRLTPSGRKAIVWTVA